MADLATVIAEHCLTPLRVDISRLPLLDPVALRDQAPREASGTVDDDLLIPLALLRCGQTATAIRLAVVPVYSGD